MREYRQWKPWIFMTETAYPYAEEVFSNEIYVLVSAIAMNALLAFFPFVILLVSISSRFFPGWHVHTMTYKILGQYLPSNQDFVIGTIRNLSSGVGKIQFISFLVLIWSIANVFIPLEIALNRAWGVRKSRGFWRSQFLAMVMVFVSGIISFFFIAGAAATQRFVEAIVSPNWTTTRTFMQFVNVKLWMIPMTLVMSCIIFYAVPNTKVSLKEVLPAGILTGLLWEISNYAYMLVLPILGFADIYGGFVVTVTLMTWAYVGGLILVFAANLITRRRAGERVTVLNRE